jgi:enterochelin esterase-like enzyme
MRRKLILFAIIFMVFINGNIVVPNNMNSHGVTFESFSQFKNTLDSLANIKNSQLRESAQTAFWDTLRHYHQIPFVRGDSVAFLYKGEANSVLWHGDFDGWNPKSNDFKGTKIGLSDIWICTASFQKDARLDYKVVVDGKWILDRANERQQWSGWGPNSELRMPDWKNHLATIRRFDVPRGDYSNDTNILSSNLGYSINYRIYTPAGYDSLSNLPVIYVTDGHEYSGDRLGSMIVALDNLIHDKKIAPVIAVFIDPRNPDNKEENRRHLEYMMNEKFARFVAVEIVPKIDNDYKTDPSPTKRLILGTSLGGINSAYFGISQSDVFGLIAINSPAFNYKPEIYSMYRDSSILQLKIFMSTGVIHDTEASARQMKKILEQKNYPLKYIEVNEGHSWGNWRGLLDDILIYFFGE